MMTYEDVGDGRSVEALEYVEVNLADKDTVLDSGTRAVICFVDHDGHTRYFRFLIHTAIGGGGSSFAGGFGSNSTALQFEELVAGRIIVPLGIRAAKVGYEIVTSEDLPAHFVSREVSSLMWSIRPSQRAYVGAELYDRAFPIATVVFRVNVPATEDKHAYVHRYRQHPPAWVGQVTQRNLTSRSYMNSTYCISINRRGRQHRSELRQVIDDYQDRFSGTVHTVRYWYNLTMVDGAAMEFEDYDPPVDVDDQV